MGFVPTPISDPADPRIAEYVGLKDSELRRAVEGAGGRFGHGIFITEGAVAIERLLVSPYPVRSVLLTDARLAQLESDLRRASEHASFDVFVAPVAVLRELSGFDLHRGAVASADRLPGEDPASVLAAARHIAVLEDLNDQVNLGALFRNAAALGVGGVLLSPRCADPLYRRTVRVSVGNVLHVPWARLTEWPGALSMVRAEGLTVAALTPASEAEPIDALVDDVAAGRVPRVAILVGAEGPGLTGAAMAAADRLIRIPMAGGVDSLNVSVAAAIAFHRLCAPRA